ESTRSEPGRRHGTHRSRADRALDHGQFPKEALPLKFRESRTVFETSGWSKSPVDWNRPPAKHLALLRKWFASRIRVSRFAFGAAPSRQRSFPVETRCVERA